MAKEQVSDASPTVLVVESDVLVRMVICDYLRSCGYRVIEAAGRDEALTLLQKPDLRIDVVFSDAQLGGVGDGFLLSQWVRTNRPEVEIILVGSTAGAADAAADLCDKGPMLSRPVEPQAIVDLIRRILAGRAPRTS